MKRFRSLRAALAVAASCLTGIHLHAAEPPKPAASLSAEAKIDRATAEKTALARVPNGRIKEGELEREHGRLIWSFDIAQSTSPNITEVQVDAIALLIAIRHAGRDAWTKAVGATFAAFALAVVAVAVAVFPAMDRWQDIASLVRAIDVDVGKRPLALYRPDETIVAVIDRTLAARRRDIAVASTTEASETLLRRPEAPVFLTRLIGRGNRPVFRRLRSLGIKLRPARPSPAVDELAKRLGLSIERIYELPQGRRYALLSGRKAVAECCVTLALHSTRPPRSP